MKNTARFLIVLVVFVFTVFTVQADDEIRLAGIDGDKDLSEWVDQTVLQKYKKGDDTARRNIKFDAIKAMSAKGYYEAEVRFDSDDKENGVLHIDKGSQYKISSIAVEGISGIKVTALKSGDVLDALSVLEAQRKLAEDIQSQSCFFNLSLEHEVRLDRSENTGAITFIVKHGPPVKFGTVTFKGAPQIDRDYLHRFVAFKPGECWKRSKIEKTKEDILATGLVSLVREIIPDRPPPDGKIDVVFDMSMRAPRSVKLGVSYYTDEGPGLVAEWEHRNFRGSGEKLSARLQTNMIEQSLSADYTKPFFMDHKDRALNLSAKLGHEETDAYITRGLALSAIVDNRFHKYLKGSTGLAFEAVSITDKNKQNAEELYGLMSVPTELVYDNRDSPLNPTRGWWIRLRGDPYIDLLGESDPFLKTGIAASTYFTFSENRDFVIALRGRLGGLIGSSTENIPANKRFYAGGGGSIRGFGYQEAGPKKNGDPAGGRSVIETSVELRYRFNETMGGVVFIDGGGAYDAAFPDFNEGYYVGAGIGFRYYTGFGPLRFDVAVPVKERDKADSSFQIYASIGQAF